MSKRSVSILIFVLMLMLSCGLFATPLPTPMPVAQVPAYLPQPTITYPPVITPQPAKSSLNFMSVSHKNIYSLIREVTGENLVDYYLEEHIGRNAERYPDNRLGYYIELYLDEDLTREEVLVLAYEVIAEIYYNFHVDPMFVTMMIMPANHTACRLSVGLGYRKISIFLPKSEPTNIEVWLEGMVRANGGYPIENEDRLVYADDFNDVGCTFYEWMDL